MIVRVGHCVFVFNYLHSYMKSHGWSGMESKGIGSWRMAVIPWSCFIFWRALGWMDLIGSYNVLAWCSGKREIEMDSLRVYGREDVISILLFLEIPFILSSLNIYRLRSRENAS